MTVTDRVRYVISEVHENSTSFNWWKNRVIVPYVLGTATRLHPSYPGYRNAVRVMEEDWDNLIVLDACRADVFEDVADFDYFDEYTRKVSLGSHSSEWTERNFARREFGDTVYVSANPHTAMIAEDSFHELIEMRETDFDEEMQTVLPERIVDATIDAYGDHEDKRLIVHFMQPHAPFVYEGASPPPFEGTEEEYWSEYEKTLEHVLSYARELADEIGGKTVITADHGQSYQTNLLNIEINPHPPRVRLPELVVVPWAIRDGERREIQDEGVRQAELSDDLESRLRNLGYRS
jgi:hypothetical protein